MKYVKYIIILFFVFISFAFNVDAYGINKYYVDGTVLSNGDLKVKEYFELDGYYNGYERRIYYKRNSSEIDNSLPILGYSSLYDSSGIELIKIMAADKQEKPDFNNITGTDFYAVSSANKGDFGKYVINDYINGFGYKMFLPSKNDKAFYIEYTIKNICVKHNDVGEIWWKIFDKNEMDEDIDYFDISITFNDNDSLRVWAHGPLNGTVEKIGNNKLHAYITDFKGNSDNLSFRAVFNKNIIKDSNKLSNIDALNKILEYEENSANEANYERMLYINGIKKKFEEEIVSCQKNPNRYCYETLVDYLKTINDNEYAKEYLTVLNEIKTNYMKLELISARYKLDYYKEHPTYDNYYETYSFIDELDESEDKKTLYNEITKLEYLAINAEKLSTVNYSVYAIIISFVFLVITYYNNYYYNKKGNSSIGKYYRDLVKDSPGEISYLLYGEVNNDTLSADILLMIDKGIIKYVKDEKDKDNYFLELDTKKNLSTKEAIIKKIIFRNSDKVSYKAVKKSIETSYNSSYLYYRWKDYTDECKKEDKANKYTIKNKYKSDKKYNTLFYIIIALIVLALLNVNLLLIIFAGALLIPINHFLKLKKEFMLKDASKLIFFALLIFTFGYMVSFYSNIHYFNEYFRIMYIPLIIGCICSYFIGKIIVKSEDGIIEYKKVIGLKNYLRDFSLFDDKDLPDIKLWNKYLAYAVVLKEAKKLVKFMELKMKDVSYQNNSELLYNYYMFDNINRLNRQLSSGIIKQKNYTLSKDRSSGYGGSGGSSFGSFSSGSGGGGGFSSSSSGGSGGGGGSRF